MNRRRLPPVLGHIAWMYAVPGFALPQGLLGGDQVVIVGARSENEVQVRDTAGKLYGVPPVLLDCGFEFEVGPGEWRYESDPSVISMLRAEIAKINEEKLEVDVAPQSLEDLTELTARILVRHADQPKQ